MALRVLHTVHSARPSAGAETVSLRGLIAELNRAGSESAVRAEISDRTGANTPPATTASRTAPDRRGSDGEDPAAFDLIHIHGWDYPLARRMAVAAGKAKKPYVITPHGLSIADGRRRLGLKMRLAWLLRDRRLVRAATFIAAVNEYEQQQLLRAEVHSDVRILPYGLNFAEYAMAESLADSEPRASARADSPVSSSANPSRDIPRREREEAAESTLPPCQGGTKGGRVQGENAIPTRDRQGETSNAPSRQILVLGDITPDSGCVALLKCLAELGPDAEGWHVVLAGPIPEKWKSALQLAVRRKGAEERVSFADAADISAQRDLLARSALLVVPSPVVRAPIAATQALAAGVPVLCTAPAAPPEMNAHVHLCGLDRTALREKLREILRTPDQTRIQSAASARTHAASALDWSTLTGRFIEAYESAL